MGRERKTALTLAGLVAATTLLAGCGEPKAVPMDDEYAGNSGETAESQQTDSPDEDSDGSDGDAAGSAGTGSDGTGSGGAGADGDASASDDSADNAAGGAGEDTGAYADGTYSINGQYGPIGEDTIDVHLTIKGGAVADVDIVGHPFTTISKKHQDAFAEAIGDVVIGKPLAGLSVDTVAGASWTTEAFNAALDVAREEASIPQ